MKLTPPRHAASCRLGHARHHVRAQRSAGAGRDHQGPSRPGQCRHSRQGAGQCRRQGDGDRVCIADLPHCAAFSNDVYPAFKTEYIDSGKVKFILRPFIRNLQDAVIFLLAEAAGEAKYHQVIETYFKTQAPGAWPKSRARRCWKWPSSSGFTDETFDAALANQELFEKLKTMQQQDRRGVQPRGHADLLHQRQAVDWGPRRSKS